MPSTCVPGEVEGTAAIGGGLATPSGRRIAVMIEGTYPDNFPPALRFEVIAEGTVTDRPLTLPGSDLRETADASTLGLLPRWWRADWCAVDHRPNSDVDVSIQWLAVGDADMAWWQTNNAELFATIDARLPGKLQILEENDPVTLKVRAALVVHQDRNVFCVLMPRKP